MEEKKRTTPLRRHFPLAFLFPLQKNVCIYTHIKRGDTCVHTWWMEKEGKKKGKEKGERGKEVEKMKMENEKGRQRERTKTLSSFCTAFCFSLLFFSLLFFVFFLDLKKRERGRGKEEDCHYYCCSPRHQRTMEKREFKKRMERRGLSFHGEKGKLKRDERESSAF